VGEKDEGGVYMRIEITAVEAIKSTDLIGPH
jgi:hypothetical protein